MSRLEPLASAKDVFMKLTDELITRNFLCKTFNKREATSCYRVLDVYKDRTVEENLCPHLMSNHGILIYPYGDFSISCSNAFVF